MPQQAANSAISRIAKLLRYAKPYRTRWVVIALLTLSTSGLALIAPWPMQVLVDHALGSVPMSGAMRRFVQLLPSATTSASALVFWIAIAGLLLFVVSSYVDALLNRAWLLAGQRMVYDLSVDLFAVVQRRSLLFHTRSTVGDLMSRITGDNWAVYTLIELLLLAPARAILTMLFMIALMVRMDWKLTLVALAAAPVMACSTFLLAPPIRVASKLRREIESRLLSHVQQTLTGIPVVQAFAQETREQERFRAFADAAIGAQKRATVANSFHSLGTGLIATLGNALVLWIGIRHVLHGQITLGGVLIFIAYLAVLQEQMKTLVGLNASVQGIIPSVDRVLELLDSPPEIVEAPNAKMLFGSRGLLRFESVTFGYDRDRPPILEDVSLELPSGATIAVVGSSGAGKSTLASLVPRFVDPWNGRVTLDGMDLRDLQLTSLRRHVAVVLQEPFLFPFTIAQNIAYGTASATRQQIENAARAAGCETFIRQLPQGYETILGERGVTLSGGERQRLSIARALLKDAPVLILDEPTASLDSVTEAGLLAALDRLKQGRTTLVIAHRLSTIRDADAIAVIDKGHLAELGTHQQLLAANGLYARLYEMQTGRRLAMPQEVDA